MELADFDLDRVRERVAALNDRIQFFELSCRTLEGIGAWASWLAHEMAAFQGSRP
jgi:Ni2+-binding GTPase involved in maturation of urease and hydrogenase